MSVTRGVNFSGPIGVLKDDGTIVEIADENGNIDAPITTTTLTATTGTFSGIISADAGVQGVVDGVLATFMPTAVQQELSGAGAVNLTTYYTAVTNTGADALTLADSTVLGQVKKIKMIVDPGTDSTLTFNGTATIVFADVGDYAVLIWNGSDWIPVELGNDADGATAPVYTPAA